MFYRKQKQQPSSYTPGLSILLVLAVVISALTGCGNQMKPAGETQSNIQQTVSGKTVADGEQQELLLIRIENEKEKQYKAALELMENDQYKDAMEAFAGLEDYEDSAEYYLKCTEYYKAQQYDEALWLINDCQYDKALQILDGIKSLDADYEGVSSLSVYCSKQEERSRIDEAVFAEDYQLVLDLIEAFPDCMERAEYYTWLMYVVLFERDAAYEAWSMNIASFDHLYPKGSIWVIDGYADEILKDYWTDEYILKLEMDENHNCILCEDLPENVLRNVRSGEHFVVVGEFYDFDPEWDDYFGDSDGYVRYINVGAFSFRNCRILSETIRRDKYAGVFYSEHTLSEVTGAEKYLRQYAENTAEEEIETKQAEPGGNVHDSLFAVYEVPYYSVEVPEEISDQISIDVDEVGNAMWFDWKVDDNSDIAHYLFGIIICTDRNTSSLDQVHPMHDILGNLTTANGEELYITAVYPRPNSLSFEDENMMEAYGEFANEWIPRILESIQGVNGCTYQVWEKNG